MPGQLCEHGAYAQSCQRCIDAYPFPNLLRREPEDTLDLASLQSRVESLGRRVAAAQFAPSKQVTQELLHAGVQELLTAHRVDAHHRDYLYAGYCSCGTGIDGDLHDDSVWEGYVTHLLAVLEERAAH